MQRRNRFILVIFSAVGATVLLIGGTVWAVTAAPPEDVAATPDQIQSERTTTPSASVADTDGAESPSQSPSTIPARTEEALALEAAELMTTWTPADDFNQTASELRARHLMTDARAADVVAPKRPASGEDWRVAADRNATSDPTVELNPHTEDSRISVIATWRWVADGYNPIYSDQRRAFYFTFTEEDGELKIYDYTWETLN